MKKNDDILTDLENDISQDWKMIQQKTSENKRKIEEEKEFKDLYTNPRRFFLPSFRRFYDALLSIFKNDGNREYHVRLHEVIRGIFSNHYSEKETMPKAFNTVWEIFCDPSKYNCVTGIKCRRCKSRYDIMYEQQVQRRFYQPLTDRVNNTINLSMINVSCPICGEFLVTIQGGIRLFGVFNHIHVDEREEYKQHEYGGRDGIRNKFRDYF